MASLLRLCLASRTAFAVTTAAASAAYATTLAAAAPAAAAAAGGAEPEKPCKLCGKGKQSKNAFAAMMQKQVGPCPLPHAAVPADRVHPLTVRGVAAFGH